MKHAFLAATLSVAVLAILPILFLPNNAGVMQKETSREELLATVFNLEVATQALCGNAGWEFSKTKLHPALWQTLHRRQAINFF